MSWRFEALVPASGLFVWLLIQLAALALAAFRVPLASQYPQPGEFQAVRVMLAAQFASLATLFPWMLRTWGAGLAATVSGWALLAAATMLSGGRLSEMLPTGGILAAWILIYTTLSRTPPGRWASVVVAVSITYVIGGPLLWYFHLEYSAAPPSHSAFLFGPLLAAITTCPHFPPSLWMQTAAIVCIAVILRVWTRAITNRRLFRHIC